MPSSAVPSRGPDDAAQTIRDHISRGLSLDDALFDRLFSARSRELSAMHWTPLDIAPLAVAWLTEGGARSVLDVGAGVGKLCLYGALTAPGVRFTGIEQRPALVTEGSSAARALGVSDRVELRRGLIDDIDPSAYDAFYLYNPFCENLVDGDGERIDGTVEASRARFDRDVRRIEQWLNAAPVGTRVVTLIGFGGWVPGSYRLVHAETYSHDALRAWEKTTNDPSPRRAFAERRR